MFDADFIVADSSNPRLGPELPPSDLVSAQFNLHYTFDTPDRANATLANISQGLKPGGYLLITIPNSDYILTTLHNTQSSTMGNKLFSLEMSDFDPLRDPREPIDWGTSRRYTFYLEDSVDNVDEYLIMTDELIDMAEDHGLRLVYDMTFNDIVNKDLREDERELMSVLVPDAYKQSKFLPIPKSQWDVFKLYKVMVFVKERTD